jgi:hypothetical protein
MAGLNLIGVAVIRSKNAASQPKTEKASAATGERLSNFALVLNTQGEIKHTSRFIHYDLRCGLIHFNLGAHFLDLRCLLFQLSG